MMALDAVDRAGKDWKPLRSTARHGRLPWLEAATGQGYIDESAGVVARQGKGLKMTETRTFLPIAAMAIVLPVMAACSGGGGTPSTPPAPTSVDFSGVTPGYTVPAGTVEIAAGGTRTVGDITFSCAAGGANCTVTVAANGTATYATNGGRVSAANSPAYQARLTVDQQRATVQNAIAAAQTAVNGLTAMSTDAEVTAAQAAVDAARAALAAATALAQGERMALGGQIASAEADLASIRMTISEQRTAEQQRTAVRDAIAAARTAIDDLSDMSTDAEVAAAQAAVDAARATLAAATALAQGERTALGEQIASAEADLGSVRMAISERRTVAEQRNAVVTAIAAARAAVDGLNDTSTDAEVAAAQAAISAAQASLTAATKLPPSEVAALSGQIAAAETTLTAVRTQIVLRKVATLYGEASKVTTDAAAILAAANQAAEDAAKYAAMLTVLSVGGDSDLAEANARKVLAAEAAAGQAVVDAEATRTRAINARAEADALPADNPDRATLIVALDAAVVEAAELIAAARAVRDSAALRAAVQAVAGADAQNPRTPAQIGTGVANAVGAALADDGGTPARVTVAGTLPADGAVTSTVVAFDDAQGMTWAGIVGEANLVDQRIATGASTTKAVKAVSVAGMMLTDVFAAGSIPSDIATAGDGTQYDASAGSNYKAIAGVIFCAGSDCGVEGTGAAQTLAGSWYFTPDDPAGSYVADTSTQVEDYVPELLYARYGHWLTVDGTGAVTVNVYSAPGASGTPQNFSLGVASGEPSTATYTGNAAGMSVHRTFDVNGAQTGIASGAFTADVRLTARFGTSPTLEGSVESFRGSAVDSGWTVEFSEQAFGSGSFSDGTTNENTAGTNQGTWTATAYGDDSAKRPAGVYGSFDAYFPDGAAAGAYVAR